MLNAAMALHRNGSLGAAQQAYREILTIDPENADALHLLGVTFGQQKLPHAAIGYIEAALRRHVAPEFFVHHGLALYEMKEYGRALDSFASALVMAPDMALAHFNRGRTLIQMGKYLEARDSLTRAIELEPENPVPYRDRASARDCLGDAAGAIEDFSRALELRPDYPEALAGKALATLLTGDLETGWPLYEVRTRMRGTLYRWPDRPAWDGKESLKGKTLLVHAEQGLGDTIQFCRYTQQLARMGARVVLEVQRPLLVLLKGVAGASDVVARGDPLPPCDLHVPMLGLPMRLGTTLDTIPSPGRYLRAADDRLAAWKPRLPRRRKPRALVVWSGSRQHVQDARRTIRLDQILPHLPEGFEYFAMQHEVRPVDFDALANSGMRNLGAEVRDFADTAAICELCDVVITVDTSMAHLAGALKRPTFLLLPFTPDWRWMRDRDDSPWYPSMRLVRQDAQGDWESALMKLESVLNHFLETRRRRPA